MMRQLRGNSADDLIPPDHSRQGHRNVAQGFRCQLSCCRGERADRASDGRDKTTAASADSGDVPVAGLAVRQGAAQRGNMELQIAFDDGDMGPDPRDQLRLADHLAGMFDESDQEIESATAEMDGLVTL